jgi:hypothetical protein
MNNTSCCEARGSEDLTWPKLRLDQGLLDSHKAVLLTADFIQNAQKRRRLINLQRFIAVFTTALFLVALTTVVVLKGPGAVLSNWSLLAFNLCSVGTCWHMLGVAFSNDGTNRLYSAVKRLLGLPSRRHRTRTARQQAVALLSEASKALENYPVSSTNPIEHLSEWVGCGGGACWDLAAGALHFVSGDRVGEQFSSARLLEVYDRAIYLLQTNWVPYPGWKIEG